MAKRGLYTEFTLEQNAEREAGSRAWHSCNYPCHYGVAIKNLLSAKFSHNQSANILSLKNLVLYGIW